MNIPVYHARMYWARITVSNVLLKHHVLPSFYKQQGFESAMQQQRERARLHWSGSGVAQLPADVR
jgi:hypothetical protein